MPLILPFILALPFIEFYGFIAVGSLIGLWPTLALVAASMVTGIVILRRRGYATLELAQKSLAKRESPLPPLLHGLTIAVAGALLVIPGFFTDIVALLLLMPSVRSALGRFLWGALMRSGSVMVWADRSERPDDAIEGEFREVKEEPKRLG
jgi:UPF0716 protein FxsA